MKISVVMATYNGEKYLEQQIESVLKQTLKPAEFIVCDDGSTDDTVFILEKYRQQEKLKYVVNSYQLGVIENFKKATSLASKTNYIALCDQDDEWLPTKLEKSAALLNQIEDVNLPCMVYTDLVFVDENDKILNSSFRNEFGHDKFNHNLQTLLFTNFVTGCTILINPTLRNWFADIPAKVRSHDEWLALIVYTFGKAGNLNESLVNYRKHSTNVSISTYKKSENKYYNLLKQLITSIKGQDDFLMKQFEVVREFYKKYDLAIPKDKKKCFDEFLTLHNKSYLIKKLYFRRVVKKFQL